MEEKGNFWNYLIIMIIVIFIGYNMWKDHEERKASLNWPSTTGRIVQSYVKEIEHTTSDNNNVSRHSYTDFQVMVQYEYKVDDRGYTGTRIKVTADSYSRESDASKALKDYKEGTKVEVFYNPRNPKYSVLTPG